LSGNPLFVDSSNNNFRLQSGSPAIDEGVDLSSVFGFSSDIDNAARPSGSGWDIGAYEFGGEVVEGVCGNDIIESREVCDGSDLGGEDCVSQGFDSGTLGCLADCSGFNTSLCTTRAVCVDGDRDGYNITGGACGVVDCNDNDINVFPGAPDALCNNIDNDCDGSTDEDYVSRVTSCGVGECAGNTGSMVCIGGVESDNCNPLRGAGTETCDNNSGYDGLDNNCDGTVDLNCDAYCDQDGDSYSSHIVCALAGYSLGDCDDNNRNRNPGEKELCDNIDNDCDVSIDGSQEPWYKRPTNCGVGECKAQGVRDCVNGLQVNTCVPGSPIAESCDKLDNDCNGVIDNGLTKQTTCGLGECSNNTGIETCNLGRWGRDTCNPFEGRIIEVCDGVLDDDCDGSVDEGCNCIEGRTRQCGSTDVGACEYGTQTCSLGKWGGCVGNIEPVISGNDVSCDNIDNDCDGSTDEDYVNTTTRCGIDSCSSGSMSCIGGVESDTCNPSDCECPEGLDSECDDGLFCNGIERCARGDCILGTAPVVDDNVFCTNDNCNETLDVIVNNADDNLCGIGEACDANRDCVQKTCSYLGGTECISGEYCPGNILSASDSKKCCDTKCESPSWSLCSECGNGLFNICDGAECNTISEGCYFDRDNRECNSCSNAVCGDYDTQNSCKGDRCDLNECGWRNGTCQVKNIVGGEGDYTSEELPDCVDVHYEWGFPIFNINHSACDDKINCTIDRCTKGGCAHKINLSNSNCIEKRELCVDSDKDGLLDYNAGSCTIGMDRCIENFDDFSLDRKSKLIPLSRYVNLSFDSREDIRNISRFEIFKKGKAKIEYKEKLRLIRFNETGCYNPVHIDPLIEFEDRKVIVHSSDFDELNKSADITYYNVDFENPIIKKDGQNCKECRIISYNKSSGELVVEVEGFSEYEVIEGPYCGDGSCNNEELCSSCAADCGTCPVDEPPILPPAGGSTGGSGGGGGGRGGASIPSETNLDNEPGFKGSSGHIARQTQGDEATFTLNNKKYVINIAKLKTDSLTIDVSGNSLVFKEKDKNEFDVDDNGYNDISITLRSINGGRADVIYKWLIKETTEEKATEEKTTEEKSEIVPEEETEPSIEQSFFEAKKISSKVIISLSILLLLFLISLTIYKKYHKPKGKKVKITSLKKKAKDKKSKQINKDNNEKHKPKK